MLSSPSRLFVAKPLIEFQSIDSTNAYAIELISKSNPSEGTAIIAQYQTDGVGQYGRKWVGEEGKNLMLSVILKPVFLKPTEQFYLTIITALSIAEVLESHLDKHIRIKWPNDIYVDRKKIAGVLIQNTLKSSRIEYTVVGVGLNVNQQHFSTDLANPTSIYNEKQDTIDILQVREQLFDTLEQNYLLLKGGKRSSLRNAYLDRLFQKNVSHKYQLQNGDTVEGVITGVADQGHLQLQIGQKDHLFQLNEINYIL